MLIDSKYMSRCICLAQKARGYTSPNPMVGAVLVYNDQIIGEGYHRMYGEPHAEVNAINSVKDKSLLPKATLYVSLEPCAHYGKTPPCAKLIVDSKIPRVVIGCKDPFAKVAGRGIEILQSASIETVVGVLEEECKALNKTFFFTQLNNRPYIILKWAQTKDGFIDKTRKNKLEKPYRISSDFTSILTHQLRSYVDAILIGTETAILDDPKLDTRLWFGKNPKRIILDKKLRIPKDYHIFDQTCPTFIVTDIENQGLVTDSTNITYIFLAFTYDASFWNLLFEQIKELGVQSILIEGGKRILQSLISLNIWDQANLEVSDDEIITGVEAPKLHEISTSIAYFGNSKKIKYINNSFKNL